MDRCGSGGLPIRHLDRPDIYFPDVSDCKDIHEYCSKYQEGFDTICGLVSTVTEIPAKAAEVLL